MNKLIAGQKQLIFLIALLFILSSCTANQGDKTALNDSNGTYPLNTSGPVLPLHDFGQNNTPIGDDDFRDYQKDKIDAAPAEYEPMIRKKLDGKKYSGSTGRIALDIHDIKFVYEAIYGFSFSAYNGLDRDIKSPVISVMTDGKAGKDIRLPEIRRGKTLIMNDFMTTIRIGDKKTNVTFRIGEYQDNKFVEYGRFERGFN